MVRFGVGSCALLWLPRRVRIAHSDISLARFTTVWHDLSLPPTRQLRAADVHPIFFATLRVNYSTLTPLVTFFLHFLILLFAPPKHVFNYHRWSDSCTVFFSDFHLPLPIVYYSTAPFLARLISSALTVSLFSPSMSAWDRRVAIQCSSTYSSTVRESSGGGREYCKQETASHWYEYSIVQI